MKFRTLKASEIDVRTQSVKQNVNGYSCIALLYKDARCDMNILDEVVGSFNWKREHVRNNANCIVSIWDDEKEQWISKEDTGTESNTEKEKGLASDSFKRACFNWGIGRELYTAPLIWINLSEDDYYIKNNKPIVIQKFHVSSINYNDNREIIQLTILDKSKKIRFAYHKNNREKSTLSSVEETTEIQETKTIDKNKIESLQGLARRKGITPTYICKKLKIDTFSNMTVQQYVKIMGNLRSLKDKVKKENPLGL